YVDEERCEVTTSCGVEMHLMARSAEEEVPRRVACIAAKSCHYPVLLAKGFIRP
ncbi:unnamed protein product, partial [Ectocarpus sp. 6 AP-2014]